MNSSRSGKVASAFLALVLSLCSPTLTTAQESFPTETLTIETSDNKTHEFTVELATTNAQRQQGLMFRKTMTDNHGMLFDFGADRDVTMWMKNTFIPLDMLFMSKSGKIEHIGANAVPHSESIIGSGGSVRYVLELNGGLAAKLRIKAGDVVRSKQIGNNK
ncbi:DUF192 domain-containing protein [Agrobacterium larrymoorei]|uniref:DUF192 domain-containing protein n=1 Tax=Agrobacterium larrymoorei TaxID=160699 RepID=UPI0015745D43|nr:DUF192 domain-containing protein [Agrobacterium larrymoorei]NTJ42484.1 DUF192 domain-containing protein [Agrobacterium larrymoorei]